MSEQTLGGTPPESHPATTDNPRLDGALARWLTPTSESRIERIACDHVHHRPWWPEPDGDSAALEALRISIATRGIIEPLLLRHRSAGGLEVVAGSRRLRAARELGMARVPAIVRDLADREAILVSAWTTRDRRERDAEGADAVRALLLDIGLSEEEARAIAGSPAQYVRRTAEPVLSAPVPPFIFRATLAAYRGTEAWAPFARVSVGVVPVASVDERAEALEVLETVRPASIAT